MSGLYDEEDDTPKQIPIHVRIARLENELSALKAHVAAENEPVRIEWAYANHRKAGCFYVRDRDAKHRGFNYRIFAVPSARRDLIDMFQAIVDKHGGE